MVQEQTEPIEFFEHLKAVSAELNGRDAVIFLDYDGTLTPIVATPDLAVLSEEMRQTVCCLAQSYKVAIVSGRATDDVRGKVKIEKIFYAGSHGFEIVTPEGELEVNQQAQAIRPVIDEVHAKLKQRLQGVPGALVEDVKYTISAHYRLVSEKDFSKVEEAVENILKEYPQLRRTHGKKVFELRPKIDWHKGKAVEWILNVLRFDPKRQAAIYIGDDTTDEDAFAALVHKGFGILVADPARASKAKYVVKNTPEVQKVLEFFIQRKEETRKQ